MSNLTKWVAAVLVVLAIVAGALVYFSSAMRGKPGLIADIGGPFTLASAKGGTVNSGDLRGAPYALFFGFTHCPEVCPTTLYEMSNNLTALGDAAKDLRVFFITVDPARDTLATMKDYVSNFDPRIEALVPSDGQLKQLASDFRVYYARVPTSDGGYTMDHTASIFLFDRSGRFAGTLAYDESDENKQAKLKRLLGG